MTLPITLADAFTRTAGAGNRAGVVTEAAGLSETQMSAIAHAVGVSETAFMLTPPLNHGVELRFFTPTTEIPFCGHATVATFHVLAERGVLKVPGLYVLNCPAGNVEVELESVEQAPCRVWIATPQYPWSDSPIPRDRLMNFLGGNVQMIDASLPILLSGTKLFVPIARRKDLWSLSRDSAGKPVPVSLSVGRLHVSRDRDARWAHHALFERVACANHLGDFLIVVGVGGEFHVHRLGEIGIVPGSLEHDQLHADTEQLLEQIRPHQSHPTGQRRVIGIGDTQIELIERFDERQRHVALFDIDHALALTVQARLEIFAILFHRLVRAGQIIDTLAGGLELRRELRGLIRGWRRFLGHGLRGGDSRGRLFFRSHLGWGNIFAGAARLAICIKPASIRRFMRRLRLVSSVTHAYQANRETFAVNPSKAGFSLHRQGAVSR